MSLLSKSGMLEVHARGERELQMKRKFHAPKQLVFDAHTKAELVRRWCYGPEGWSFETCEIDLKVDGTFRYVWRSDDGRTMGMKGRFLEIQAPDRIVHTEIFDEDWTGGETIVTTLFEEVNGITHLSCSVVYASKEAREGALRTGMVDGMEMGYARIESIIAAGVS